MKILIDTNILIDYFMERKPYFENANSIIILCSDDKLKGGIAAHSVSNAIYIMRKEYSVVERKKLLFGICKILKVISIDSKKIMNSLNNDKFDDFEDCLQVECAKEFNADYIITRNIKDFESSEIPAILPDEFLKKL